MVKFKKEDLIIWDGFRSVNKSVISHDEYTMICKFHAHYFEHRLEEPCKCAPKRINQLIADLNKVWDQSQKKTQRKRKNNSFIKFFVNIFVTH